MADYNTAALITQVLDEGKDASIPRARILTYLQRAQDEVLGRHRFKFSETDLIETLSTDSTTFEFDDDHQQIVQVVLSHLDLATPSQPEFISNIDFFDRYAGAEDYNAGLPSFYTDYGGVLYWDKPLDKSYTIGLRYIAAPCRLEDDDSSTPDVPQEFADILIKGALARLEEYRENHDIAATYKRQVEDLSEDMLGRYGLRKMQPGKARTTRRRNWAW